MSTRNEAMAEFDEREQARAHRRYISGLKTARTLVETWPVTVTEFRDARLAVVWAIDKLITEAEAFLRKDSCGHWLIGGKAVREAWRKAEARQEETP